MFNDGMTPDMKPSETPHEFWPEDLDMLIDHIKDFKEHVPYGLRREYRTAQMKLEAANAKR